MTMAVRYAPIPSRSDPDTNPELDAAFDDSDDDDEPSETHPLHPHSPSPRSSLDDTNTIPTYDFNTPVAEWDQPPPGSPPPATSLALPNSIGNSNGVIPTFSSEMSSHTHSTWWRRATAFIPQFGRSISSGRTRVMGGGAGNDGVFSNVSAKPATSGTRVQEGDSIYIVPEESSSAAPPSYAAAQADAAPPYHTSLVLLPPSLYDANALSGSPSPGSAIVDGLPTGTLFAFLWNTLVSTTFQFVGFVLTWVMHTTHAAKFGSRAGLGITLIQWGFALRTRLDDALKSGTDVWEDGGKITFSSTKEADDYYNASMLNNTTDSAADTQLLPGQGTSQWSSLLTGPTATEWLSFFMMTIGWFILLTASLGFWRVKRWERFILAAHAAGSSPTLRRHNRTQSEIADEEEYRRQPFLERIGVFRFLGRRPSEPDGNAPTAVPDSADDNTSPSGRQQGGTAWFSDPVRARRARDAFAREQRLCDDLRAAGLL